MTGAEIKLVMAVVGTVASTAMTVHGQMQQAKAAKAMAGYNAQLNRMDQEQNARNMKIEKNQARKRFALTSATAMNEGMSMDFMFADLHAFEYQMLLKDYSLAQANASLENRARAGIYQGNVKAAQYKAQALGSAISGVTTVASLGTDASGDQTGASKQLLGRIGIG
tara:strand:+ start:485 stop:985 length:501 start_codon:yes stop_codon:yes gene_type:complete